MKTKSKQTKSSKCYLRGNKNIKIKKFIIAHDLYCQKFNKFTILPVLRIGMHVFFDKKMIKHRKQKNRSSF